MADLQSACGLTPGSGALYKHFPSKEALLREVLRRHVAGIAADRAKVDTDPPGSLDAILRYGAEAVWRSMERDRKVIRITVRDLDPFPDLIDELWEGVLANVYRQFSQLLRHEDESGRIDVADPEATAAVLVASLTYLPILDGLIGHNPGDVDRDRFLDAWVESAQRTLAAAHRPPRPAFGHAPSNQRERARRRQPDHPWVSAEAGASGSDCGRGLVHGPGDLSTGAVWTADRDVLHHGEGCYSRRPQVDGSTGGRHQRAQPGDRRAAPAGPDLAADRRPLRDQPGTGPPDRGEGRRTTAAGFPTQGLRSRQGRRR